MKPLASGHYGGVAALVGGLTCCLRGRPRFRGGGSGGAAPSGGVAAPPAASVAAGAAAGGAARAWEAAEGAATVAAGAARGVIVGAASSLAWQRIGRQDLNSSTNS